MTNSDVPTLIAGMRRWPLGEVRHIPGGQIGEASIPTDRFLAELDAWEAAIRAEERTRSIQLDVCAAPGPYDRHCTEDAGHEWSHYDAGQDASWHDQSPDAWQSKHPHKCDDPTCVWTKEASHL